MRFHSRNVKDYATFIFPTTKPKLQKGLIQCSYSFCFENICQKEALLGLHNILISYPTFKIHSMRFEYRRIIRYSY